MIKKYILPVSWMGLIFLLSSIPGSSFKALPFPGCDKLIHFAEYMVLGFLWARALAPGTAAAILIGIFFGITDEYHQIFVPLRQFCVVDIVFDCIGVITGVICQRLLRK